MPTNFVFVEDIYLLDFRFFFIFEANKYEREATSTPCLTISHYKSIFNFAKNLEVIH